MSATIIVCGANELMKQPHDRMPVILDHTDVDVWFTEPRDAVLQPCPQGVLQAWRVAPKVNSNRYRTAAAVELVQV